MKKPQHKVALCTVVSGDVGAELSVVVERLSRWRDMASTRDGQRLLGLVEPEILLLESELAKSTDELISGGKCRDAHHAALYQEGIRGELRVWIRIRDERGMLEKRYEALASARQMLGRQAEKVAASLERFA